MPNDNDKQNIRLYKKELKSFLQDNPNKNIKDFDLMKQAVGTTHYSDKQQNQLAQARYEAQYQDYQKLVDAGTIEANVTGDGYDMGFHDWRRQQGSDYQYEKTLDPTNVNYRDKDSFYNNPIFRDMTGEETTGIKSDSDIVQYSQTETTKGGEQLNKSEQLYQQDLETKSYYSPKQVDWIEENAKVLGMSEEDIAQLRAANEEGMTGHGGHGASIYRRTNQNNITGEHDTTKINAMNMPGWQAGEITQDGKTWQHQSPMSLQRDFEQINSEVMNNPNLSAADKKVKLDAMREDYIEKSGEYKVTSGRQIFEEQFKPTADKAITANKMLFQEQKNNIVNDPNRIRNKFTLGGNK